MDETRAKLIDAAGYEFAERGFEGATVRSICERAGANLAAVNYHFGDKERLYEAVLLVAHRSRPTFEATVTDEAEDPRATLRRFVANFLEELVFHQSTPWHQAVMVREIAAPTKASDTLVREAIRPQFEALLAILRRLTPRSEPRQIQAIGFSVVAQCLHYKLNRSISERIVGVEAFERLDLEFLIDHITRFTLAALGHGEPLNSPTSADLESQSGPRARSNR